MRHNKGGGPTQTNLTIEIPDNLARGLEGIAAAQSKSVQQLAVEQLSSLIADPRAGSPEAVLRAVHELPYPASADVDELDAAILAGRLPVRAKDLFPADPS